MATSAEHSAAATECCAYCGKDDDKSQLKICARCRGVSYCCKEHQVTHWKQQHKKYCKFIMGTKVIRADAPVGPNPLEQVDPTSKAVGSSPTEPMECVLVVKTHTGRGVERARLVVPGPKHLTDRPSTGISPIPSQLVPLEPMPVKQQQKQQNIQLPLSSTYHRHIAMFSLQELRQVQWDGAKYSSSTLHGQWVPYVDGYDSDDDHVYAEPSPAVLELHKQQGIIGLPHSPLYVTIPNQPGVCELNDPAADTTIITGSAAAASAAGTISTKQ